MAIANEGLQSHNAPRSPVLKAFLGADLNDAGSVASLLQISGPARESVGAQETSIASGWVKKASGAGIIRGGIETEVAVGAAKALLEIGFDLETYHPQPAADVTEVAVSRITQKLAAVGFLVSNNQVAEAYVREILQQGAKIASGRAA